MKIFILILLSAFIMPYSQAAGPNYITEIIYNTDIDYTNKTGLSFLYNQSARNDVSGTIEAVTSNIITNLRTAIVDGYHEDKDGFKYYSFDVDIKLDGIGVLKNDIIKCLNSACDSFEFFFIELSFPSNSKYNINAFTIDPHNGDLIFSIDTAANLFYPASSRLSEDSINGIERDNINFFPADLIRYNFASNTYITELNSLIVPFINPDLGAESINIDGVVLLPNNKFLISFENDKPYNSINIFNRINYIYTNAYFPTDPNDGGNLNIMSLMGYENDLIFKNGFE